MRGRASRARFRSDETIVAWPRLHAWLDCSPVCSYGVAPCPGRERKRSANGRLMAGRSGENDTRGEAPRASRLLRVVVAAIVPPLLALVADMLLESTLTRWLVFNAAVIVSSWFGGLKSGIAATVLSTALVWWFLVPPVRTLGTTDPQYYLAAVIFAVIGIAVSVFHARLRRTNLALERTARERRLFAALIENSSDFIGIADPTGKPMYLNPAGRRMIGLAADFPDRDHRDPRGVSARPALLCSGRHPEGRGREGRVGRARPSFGIGRRRKRFLYGTRTS